MNGQVQKYDDLQRKQKEMKVYAARDEFTILVLKAKTESWKIWV